jgi:cyclic-di-GMP-binding protein
VAKDSSFDVVSKVDRQEVDNALNQAKKELHTRFDFKGTNATVEWTGELQLEVSANTDHRVTAAVEVFKEKCIKRQVPLKALQVGPLKETGGGGFKQEIDINQGVSTEKSREMVKLLKSSGIKVQAAIQEDHLRVSGKSRDALQAAIQLLKEQDLGIPLQFTNYR